MVSPLKHFLHRVLEGIDHLSDVGQQVDVPLLPEWAEEQMVPVAIGLLAFAFTWNLIRWTAHTLPIVGEQVFKTIAKQSNNMSSFFQSCQAFNLKRHRRKREIKKTLKRLWQLLTHWKK